MKKTFFALVLFVASFSPILAQGKRDAGTPEERAAKMTERMKADLKLNDNQVAQLSPLNLERIKKQEEWKSQLQTGDKKGIGRNRKGFMDEYEAKLKSILTPEQLTQHQQMQEQRKSDFKTKRKDKVDG